MKNTAKKGFASMDENVQRQIASKGGKAAHQKGTAHEFTSQEARLAGQKGGMAAHPKGRGLQNADVETRGEVARKGDSHKMITTNRL